MYDSWPKPNLHSKPVTNVYGSLQAQFSKALLII